MGPLGELGALFNPGMRHEEEEKRAKQMLREEEGTGRKGRLGIDLDSGVVVIGSTLPGAAGDHDGARAGGDHGNAAADHDGGPHASRGPTGGSNGAAPPADAAARRNGSAAGSNGDVAGGRSGRPAKPGEPQVARRSPAAAPEGKARRRDGSENGGGTGPVGKARRTQK